MNSIFYQFSQAIKIVFLALILSLGLSYVSAQWTGPSDNPTNGNTPSPINVGSLTQIKIGALGVTDLVANTGTFGVNVGIGTTSPSQTLSVGGMIYSGVGGFKFPDGTTQTTAAFVPVSQWTTLGNNIYSANSGNVGIGQSSPTQKLEVNGNIRGAQLCIGADCRSTWPSITSVTMDCYTVAPACGGGPYGTFCRTCVNGTCSSYVNTAPLPPSC